MSQKCKGNNSINPCTIKLYFRDSWIISKTNSLFGNNVKVGNNKKNLNPL